MDWVQACQRTNWSSPYDGYGAPGVTAGGYPVRTPASTVDCSRFNDAVAVLQEGRHPATVSSPFVKDRA